MSRLSRALGAPLRGSVLAPPRTGYVVFPGKLTARSSTSTLPSSDSHLAAAHLDSVFAPLRFPPELASRVLTHGSHKDANQGHNARLAFIGRRVLESYYLLFVHDAADSNAVYDYDVLVSRALNACLLGEHVAPRWSLGHVLRWAPAMPKANIRAVQEKKPDSELAEALATDLGIIRTVGLYKVMGEAVQAVVGGVYHQFGGSVAHRLFHTRILPYVLHSDRGSAVPPELHAGAMKICETMGGMAAYDTNGSVN